MILPAVVMSVLAAAAASRLELLPPFPEREKACPADPSKLGGDVGFDARTGERFGPSHVRAKDSISVVIHDKNPFLYSYRKSVTSAPTDISRVSEFAAALRLRPLAGRAETAVSSRTGCEGIATASTKLETSLAAFRRTAADRSINCAALHASAASLHRDAQALVDAWNRNADPNCAPADEAAKVQGAVDALRTVVATFAEPTSFTDMTSVSIPDEPTTVAVELFRTSVSDASAREERVFRAQIEVGTSRVGVSLGGAWLGLPTRTVVRQARRQQDGTAQLAFGYDENSSSHFAPVLLLHGTVVDVEPFLFMPRSEVATTFGAAVPVEGPAVDFVLGLTWAFARTVYLTLGCEFARVTRIGGGFSEGDLIPSSLADPLPTTRSWEVGPTVGLSWRVK